MLLRCHLGEKATLGMVRQEVSRTPGDMELIAKQVLETPPHEAIRNKLRKFSTNAGDNREIASIMSNAQTQLRFLDSPGVARNLASDGIDLGILKTQNVTIYLVLPPERLVTHAKWLRLIIGSAMTAMQRKPRHPDVLFMLDEFPQLGRLEAIETVVSLNAGYGVKVWAAVQHLGQLKEHYGHNWETFLISRMRHYTFAPRDVFTREHLTNLVGTGTRIVRSTSHASLGRQLRHRVEQYTKGTILCRRMIGGK